MINVVAAVIENKEGKIVIAKRNHKKAQGNLWEFPGGKIEAGEKREEALVRELQEEMGITIKVMEFLGEKEYHYPEKTINLIVYTAVIEKGDISLLEHEEYQWIEKEELVNFKFAPADEFIVEKIKK